MSNNDEFRKLLFKEFTDGEPCSHKGCLNHVTHPCEYCGRIAGKYPKRLKSCPFCGGEAKVINLLPLLPELDKAYVECKLCEVTTSYFETEEEAILFWNTRTETGA